MNLRFIPRDGKLILQQFIVSEIPASGWVDVEGQEDDDVIVKANYMIKSFLEQKAENLKSTKEYWLVAGRYFESEHDARMFNKNNPYLDANMSTPVHVKEVEE